MREHAELYLDGAWRAAAGSGRIEVHEAATGAVIGVVPAGDGRDVDLAVTAARRAFAGWSGTAVAARVGALREIADGIEARTAELAALTAQEVGTPLAIAERVQVGLAVSVFRSMADVVEQQVPHEVLGHSVVLRQAAGVVAAITPWNYPLYQLAAKVAPAVGAGCTVVVKPSSIAPLSAFAFAEIVHAAGLPAGVVNVITGQGAVVGEALAGHAGVDLVSLTGSTAAGARVAEIAARGVRRTTLELGGKSAFLLAPGADLDDAVSAAVRGCFVNNGQTCAATTRLLVPNDLLTEVEERVAAAVSALVVGDPLDAATTLGPLASAGQQAVVQGFLEAGSAEGVAIAGGPGPVPGLGSGAGSRLSGGYFVRPTAFSRLSPDATVVREEIFGPVLSLVGYASLDDGVRLANDSAYGLSGAVYAESVAAGVAIARRLRTGQVAVNGGRFNVLAPFGGYGQSGIGRELGPHGLAEYQELTSLQLPSAADAAEFGATR